MYKISAFLRSKCNELSKTAPLKKRINLTNKDGMVALSIVLKI